MKTLGHHTTENRDNVAYILQNGAFFSSLEPDTHHVPFLGEGYYFWDDNEEMAHFWGEKTKRGAYCVFTSDLVIDDATFLDLVGSRQCQKWLLGWANRLEERDGKKWAVGNLIEYLKYLSKYLNNEAIFPFKVIRAADYSQPNSVQMRLSFSERKNLKNKYTVINPVYIICVLDNTDQTVQPLQHIFSTTPTP